MFASVAVATTDIVSVAATRRGQRTYNVLSCEREAGTQDSNYDQCDQCVYYVPTLKRV
jgi:hypothetical protein